MFAWRDWGNHTVLVLLFLTLGTTVPASASLIYQTELDLGNFNLSTITQTVLSLQDDPTELGCVRYTSGGDVLGGACPGGFTGGDEKTGTQTRAISSLTGITQASDLAIIFNATEPPPANSITLNTLVLTFYTSGGTAISSYTFTGPRVFNGDNSGANGSGYVFRLDYDQALNAQALAFTGVSFGDNRIGLSADVSNSSGSPETLYIARASNFNLDPVPVPEPATFLTMGVGLIGIALYLRRRRAAN